MASISTDLLKHAAQLLPVSSDDPTRMHMNGVHILAVSRGHRAETPIDERTPKVTITATDGHCLVSREFIEYQCPPGEWLLYRSDAPSLKLILKEAGRIQTVDAALNPDGSLTVGQFTKTRILKAENFPPYKQIIPTFRKPFALSFDADLLLAVAKGLADPSLPRDAAPIITIEFELGETSGKHWAMKPMLVSRGKQAGGMLMPCRNDRVTASHKEWNERLNEMENGKCL